MFNYLTTNNLKSSESLNIASFETSIKILAFIFISLTQSVLMNSKQISEYPKN